MSDEQIQTLAKLEERSKHMQHDIEDIKQAIKELPTILDERYASKKDLEELKETVDPLTALRRRVWYVVIGLIVGQAIALLVVTTSIEDFITK